VKMMVKLGSRPGGRKWLMNEGINKRDKLL